MLLRACTTPLSILETIKPIGYQQIYGYGVNVKHSQLDVFKKSTTCAKCGLSASFFAIERYSEDLCLHFHLKLYALKESKEMTMTIDHIIPKYRGGLNKLDNYQTLCWDCNQRKGSDI